MNDLNLLNKQTNLLTPLYPLPLKYWVVLHWFQMTSEAILSLTSRFAYSAVKWNTTNASFSVQNATWVSVTY